MSIIGRIGPSGAEHSGSNYSHSHSQSNQGALGAGKPIGRGSSLMLAASGIDTEGPDVRDSQQQVVGVGNFGLKLVGIEPAPVSKQGSERLDSAATYAATYKTGTQRPVNDPSDRPALRLATDDKTAGEQYSLEGVFHIGQPRKGLRQVAESWRRNARGLMAA